MTLLRLLATLGANDKQCSEHMYEIIYSAMNKAAKIATPPPPIAFAVLYECIRTLMAIVPNAKIIAAAASHIHLFLSSQNHNFKYLGYR
jgi:AP-4 complex subunit epsilon-1